MLGLAARNLELANRVAQSAEIASGDRQVMLGITVSHDTRKHKLQGMSRFNAAEKLSMVQALIVHGQTGWSRAGQRVGALSCSSLGRQRCALEVNICPRRCDTMR